MRPSTKAVWLGAAFALGVVAWLASAPAVGQPGRQRLDHSLCSWCHSWFADEWEGSRHETSATNEVFAAAVATEPDPTRCYACHQPIPVLVTGIGRPPVARTDEPESGVHCGACHTDGVGALVGPLGDPQSPFHASGQDTSLREAADLCATCHGAANPLYDQASALAGSRYAGEGRTCQSCHTPLTNGPIAYNTREVSHERAFHGTLGSDNPEFLASAVALDVSVEGDRATARRSNVGAGHNLPGSAGPSVELSLEAADYDGNALASAEAVAGWDGVGTDARIPPDGCIEVSLEAAEGVARFRATAVYRDVPRRIETPLALRTVER